MRDGAAVTSRRVPPIAALVLAVALVVAACADSPATPTTTAAVTSSTQPGGTTTTAPAPATTTTTTTDPSDRQVFQDGFSFLPISDRFDDSTDPGAIVFHDGTWHMFLLAEAEWRVEAEVWWATSEDGMQWERQARLFDKDDLDFPYAADTLAPSSAVVLDDGTWALYFHTITGRLVHATGVIGRITAPGPEGPWIVDSEPVLEPGPEGSWDGISIGHPFVLRVGDEYWMYYDGTGSDGVRRIGLAVSTDGVTWIKHDDAETAEAALAESDPVFPHGEEGAWDAAGTYDPNVVVTTEGFVMSYLSATVTQQQTCCSYRFGLAFSDDGLAWTKDPASPFFQTDRQGFAWVGLSSLIHTGDRYLLLTNLETLSGSSFEISVWVMTHEGPIRP